MATPQSSLRQHLDALCRKGVQEKIFPGAAAAVVTGHGNRRFSAVSTAGLTRLDSRGTKIKPDTFFDLASLTKPLATTLSILVLIEQGAFTADDRYADISNRTIPPDKQDITIGHLLSHSSGLAPYRPYFKRFPPDSGMAADEQLIQQILQDVPTYATGTDCRYSDLGFILLGDLIKQISGRPLDHFFKKKITEPLALSQDIFFRPLSEKEKNPAPQNRFAATEQCGWRKRMLQGEVHDEHCFLMGGVAGHAGLFGTIGGVLHLCTSVLDSWQGGERGSNLPISATTLRMALQQQYPTRTWCLGFDTPSTDYTSAGSYLGQRSIGHLGYTGTSFWIDPVKDTILILLTNRVHPSRENKKIREFRPWFHDQVMKFLFPP
jgi:CubicO group peptidase (beta-lactamase class C family)